MNQRWGVPVMPMAGESVKKDGVGDGVKCSGKVQESLIYFIGYIQCLIF